MKTQHGSKKSILIIIAIVVLALIAYFYFSGNSSTNTQSNLTETQSANTAVVGARVLNLLRQIKSLKIDTSLFTDRAYLNLLDYSVEIPEVPVGRPNPFAPLPGESAVRSATVTR